MASLKVLVGENIRKLRKSKSPKLTQEHLAENIGVDVMTVRRWEKGQFWPGEHLESIASALNCAPWELLLPPGTAALGRDRKSSVSEAISVLQAYEKAEPEIRALALTVLTDDMSYLSGFPQVSGIYESLEKIR